MLSKKMSECQTKAGNQEYFEKLENIENFVFMSRLKSRCLKPKIAMIFFDSIIITLSCEFRSHRAGSQLKIQVLKFDPWDMLNNFCFHV